MDDERRVSLPHDLQVQAGSPRRKMEMMLARRRRMRKEKEEEKEVVGQSLATTLIQAAVAKRVTRAPFDMMMEVVAKALLPLEMEVKDKEEAHQ